MVDNKGMLTFGAIAGVVVYLLQLVIAKVARQSIVQLGSAKEVGQMLLGMTGFEFMAAVYFAIGGAVLVLTSAYLMKYLPIKPVSKTGKMTLIMVYSAILSSLIMSGTLGISIATIVPMVIGAVISAFIVLKVFEMLKIKVPL